MARPDTRKRDTQTDIQIVLSSTSLLSYIILIFNSFFYTLFFLKQKNHRKEIRWFLILIINIDS